MTSAYSVFANNGQRVPPVAILKITDFDGNVIDEYQPAPGEQVIRAEHAYLISSILSDNEARSWMFGYNSVLNLPFPVAAKTGTSGTARGDAAELVYDNWTLGYTPDLVTGVWIGNADYTPMVNTSGSTGAAPIWSQFMQYAAPIVSGGNLRGIQPARRHHGKDHLCALRHGTFAMVPRRTAARSVCLRPAAAPAEQGFVPQGQD